MRNLILALVLIFSFSVNADVYKEFVIEGDTWAIKTNTADDFIILCLQTSSVCKIGSTGVLHDYSTDRNNGVTARDYYLLFLDKAHGKLLAYYDGSTIPPDEGDFAKFLEYLIMNGTEYNSSDKTFTITK